MHRLLLGGYGMWGLTALGVLGGLRAAFFLAALPYPAALTLWLLGTAALAWGAWRRQSAWVASGWLTLTVLSGVMGGYAADELNRGGGAGPEFLSLCLGLTLLALCRSTEPHSFPAR